MVVVLESSAQTKHFPTLIILYSLHTCLVWMYLFQDTLLVIERYKSGFQPPEDFPFEDLSRESDATTTTSTTSKCTSLNSHTNHGGLKPDRTIKGTLSVKTKKRNPLLGIFTSNKVSANLKIIYEGRARVFWRESKMLLENPAPRKSMMKITDQIFTILFCDFTFDNCLQNSVLDSPSSLFPPINAKCGTKSFSVLRNSLSPKYFQVS